MVSFTKNDNELIKQVKVLKATGAIDNYYEVAELIEMSVKSFYNWLNGAYTLGSERKEKLKTVINLLSIE